jgi:hypothetical protein
MKEGRRVIVPTQRQMAESARKQAEANIIKDSQGRTGIEYTVKDIAMLERAVEAYGLSKQRQKEILKEGRDTDAFLDLKLLEILKDIRDGKKINERDDKNFKFNLESLKEKWANSEVEMMAVWDKNNRFMGYATQADKGLVQIRTINGSLVGATTLHTHPSDSDRFFGSSFSYGDLKTFRDNGEQTMIVASREGYYIMERGPKMNLTDKEITTAWVKYRMKEKMSHSAFSGDSKKLKGGYTKLDLAVWRDHHNAVKELASRTGVTYKFVPRKGFENLDK